MIKFDLHIHSIASKYKESAGVVDESTIENAEVLLQKLNETGIGLFSITDHNRFFAELYIKLDEIIQSAKYSEVKGLVAGVEFDVKIDEKMSPWQINKIRFWVIRCLLLPRYAAFPKRSGIQNSVHNVRMTSSSLPNRGITRQNAANRSNEK